ncbi:hypothetical protein [Syntrophomonas wolfei]|uniref:hypothetical protein n=1 Tax=Syntrophomonas wolfei TaxID=863 RepID=UPI00059C05DD|nr:hypothetical protein [Syntrophomonas wolfei]
MDKKLLSKFTEMKKIREQSANGNISFRRFYLKEIIPLPVNSCLTLVKIRDIRYAGLGLCFAAWLPCYI